MSGTVLQSGGLAGEMATGGSTNSSATAGTGVGGGIGGSGLYGGGGGGGGGDISGGSGATVSGGGGGGGGRHGGGGGGGLSYVAPGGNHTRIIIDSLETGQPYYLRVQAINSLGGGDWVPSTPAYAIPANVPSTPPQVKTTILYDASHRDGRSLSVSFTESVPNGREIDYYVVELARDENFLQLERQDHVAATDQMNNSYVVEINNLIVGLCLLR